MYARAKRYEPKVFTSKSRHHEVRWESAILAKVDTAVLATKHVSDVSRRDQGIEHVVNGLLIAYICATKDGNFAVGRIVRDDLLNFFKLL